MGKKRKHLSHAEIWDDSALIRSWNESYEEYKLYHSICGRGERVKDILAAHSRAEDEHMDDQMSEHAAEISAASQSEDGEIKDDETAKEPGASAEPAFNESSAAATDTAQADLPVPQAMVGTSSQDPALKSLMMAWYWAGYYTGLYEGQKHATTGMAEEVKGEGDR